MLPENDPLRRDAQPSSASVFIRHRADMDVGAMIPQIKTLVANGIAGLTYDNVSVVPVAAAATAPRSGPALSNVLGIWVLETSRMRIIALLSTLGGLSVALAGGVAWLMWRRRTQSGTYLLEARE